MNKLVSRIVSLVLVLGLLGATHASAQTTWKIKNAQEIVELKTPDKSEEQSIRATAKASAGDEDSACINKDFEKYFEEMIKKDSECDKYTRDTKAKGLKFSAVCNDVKTTATLIKKDDKNWTGEFLWDLKDKQRTVKIKGKFTAVDTGKVCKLDGKK